MRFRTFRSLFGSLAGALILAGGIVPSADAVLVTYFNFEDSTLGASPPDFTSHPPGAQSSTLTVAFGGTIPPPESVGGLTGANSNIAPGDTDPNLLAMGFHFTKDVAPAVDITFSVNTIGLTNLSLSFAINNNGNGFTTATFSYSLDGTSFTTVGGPVTLPPPPGSTQIVAFNYPNAVDNQAAVYFRVSLSGGQSQGVNLQSVVDNIQLNAIPEPATTIGGILGVGGLCWYRRRWLIRFLRFRRA